MLAGSARQQDLRALCCHRARSSLLNSCLLACLLACLLGYLPHPCMHAGATGHVLRTVDEATGCTPPRNDTLTSDTITLAPFAVAMLLL